MRSSQRIRQTLQKYQRKPVTQQGILGNEVGEISVPNRIDYVYVRVAGLGTISIYNKRVPLILDLPVDVGYDPLEPKNFQVLNIHRYPQGGGRGLVDVSTILHGKTHNWGGIDPVFIEKRQLMPLRPTPLGGMQLYVTREVTYYDDKAVQVTGQQLDLAPYVPATGSWLVLLYKDTDEIIKISTGGVLRDIYTLSMADAPQVYPGTVPIALVRLYGGQSGIAEGYQDTDLIDVRQLFSPISTGTSSGGSGGHVIQDEGVSRTQRTKLNFKGASVWAVDNAGADSTDIIISGTSSGIATGTSLDWLNVKDYGAVGNGVVDDTTAFSDLFADSVATGLVAYIPVGRYLITSDLTFGGVATEKLRLICDGTLVLGTDGGADHKILTIAGNNHNAVISGIEGGTLLIDGYRNTVDVSAVNGLDKTTDGIQINKNSNTVHFGSVINSYRGLKLLEITGGVINFGIIFDCVYGITLEPTTAFCEDMRITWGTLGNCSSGGIVFSDNNLKKGGNTFIGAVYTCPLGIYIRGSASMFNTFIGCVDDFGVGGTYDIRDETGQNTYILYWSTVSRLSIPANCTVINTLPAALSLGGYAEFGEVSAPATPPSNKLRLYAKDKSGTSTLYVKNDAGTEIEIQAAGSGPSFPNPSVAGDFVTFADNVGSIFADSGKSLADYLPNPTTDPGDLVIRGADGANVALLSVGASATASSTYSTYIPDNVLDANDATEWFGNAPVAASWIKIDLGSSETIVGWRVFQGTGLYGATSYKIESSPDNVNWTQVLVRTVNAQDETWVFPNSVTARYFRFTAITGGASGWGIFTIELYEATSYNAVHIGNEGDVLTTVSGTWVAAPPPGGTGVVTGAHTIMDEGATLPYQPVLNFIGNSLWAVNNAGQGRTDIIVSGTSSGGGHTIEDEGTPLTQRTKLNFVGASVNVTDDAGNDATIVTISNITGTGYGDVTQNGAVTVEHLAVFAADKQIKDGGAVPAGAGTDGWIAAGQTWTYEAADDPTYTFSEPIDATSKYSIGMKVKCTQGGSVKYGIITGVGAYADGKTIITAYWGTDYNLGATITSPYYSTSKAPFGFPLDPTKWTVAVLDTSLRTQLTPTQNAWYNLGTLSISIPIGAWEVSYQACVDAARAAAAYCVIYVALSTANNSGSDPDLLGLGYSSSVGDFDIQVYRSKTLVLTSKTAYYLNEKTDQTSIASINLRGGDATTVIRAICAYL